MSFKKHDWMDYGRKGDIVEITIKDDMGGKIDFFKSNNPDDDKRIGEILRRKYGRDFSSETGTHNKDLEW
jgi:hypothetical protein